MTINLTFSKYFRIGLLLPLLLGIFSWCLIWGGIGLGPFKIVIFILSMSIIVAGKSYIAFAILVFFYSKRLSESTLKTGSLVLPPLFIPFFLVEVWLTQGLSFPVNNLSLTLAVGYCYVILFWGLWGLVNLFRVSTNASAT